MASHSETRRCTVYGGRGEARVSSIELGLLEAAAPQRRESADAVPLHRIMGRDVVCARADLEVREVVRLMMQHKLGCIPVVDERLRPIGMITKFDVVEQLDVMMQSNPSGSPWPHELAARTADEAMMPIALTLDRRATVAHAASMMSSEDTHHVIVVRDDGTLAGVISSRDIVDWLVANDRLSHLDRIVM